MTVFVIGLLAVFDVDFGADLLDTTAEVAGYGFNAVAAILLGGAILVATLPPRLPEPVYRGSPARAASPHGTAVRSGQRGVQKA